MASNPATRMNNRKAPDTVGHPHDNGAHARNLPAQPHASAKDREAAIEAAEHGADARKPSNPDRH